MAKKKGFILVLLIEKIQEGQELTREEIEFLEQERSKELHREYYGFSHSWD